MASIIALFLPFLIKSFEDLPPVIRDNASINTYFTEPVSPVNTLNPLLNFINSSSKTAKFFMLRLSSILSPYLMFFLNSSNTLSITSILLIATNTVSSPANVPTISSTPMLSMAEGQI